MDWTAHAADAPTVTAPDGSRIRPLLELGRGGVSQCTIAPGGVSLAVRHRTIEEIWYFVSGAGRVWRKLGRIEETVDVGPGACLSIPTGAHFQFRAGADAPLVFVIATMPPWPGAQEAVRVADHWAVDRGPPASPQ